MEHAPIRPFLVDQPLQQMRQDGGRDDAQREMIGLSALTLVARGEAALGIVYETDAKVEPGVKIVAHFPPDSHPEIGYPVGATIKANAEAPRYIDFLQSGTSKSVFEKYGFSFLVKPTS